MALALGLLLLSFGIAVGLGLLIHRFEERQGIIDNRDRRLVSEGIGGTLGFLGGSAAFLLGVLMLTSIDHYNSTDDIATDEALAYSAVFDGSAGLPADGQARIQRDLVCLMRSVTTKSWQATEDEDLAGSPNTHAWRARVLADANAVEPSTTVQENSLATVQSEVIEASKFGQQRLLDAKSDLPTPLWLLVYVSVFALTLGLTAMLRPYPVLAVTSLATTLLLSTAMVWTLTAFAEPFSENDGVYIAPDALNGVMVRLQSTYPGKAWQPCEELMPS